MKKHKLSSIEGIDLAAFECIYSPAKRRGPVPGKAGQARKEMSNINATAAAMAVNAGGGGMNVAGGDGAGSGAGGSGAGGGGGGSKNSNLMRMDLSIGGFGAAGAAGGNNMMLQQQQLAALGMAGNMNGMGMNKNSNQGNGGGSGGGSSGNSNGDMNDAMAFQRQILMQQQMLMQGMAGMDQSGSGTNQQAMINPLAFSMMQQQLQLQQQQQVLNKMMQQMQGQQQMLNTNNNSNNNNASNNSGNTNNGSIEDGEMSGQGPAQRMRIDQNQNQSQDPSSINKVVRKHLPLLEKSSIDGNRLRSYYSLSIDVLYKFPPVPSDEEYCAKLNIAMNPMVLPQFDLAALRAARFSEIALGAMVANQIHLSLELSNAVVACLKQCAEEPVHPSCMYDVARAYFLHGMFRSYRGDMPRYFKYRRVCLAKLSQLASGTKGVEALLAAISFHDSWAYMVYNANEESLPNIDEVIPPVTMVGQGQQGQGQATGGGMEMLLSAAEKKYEVSTDPSRIASDPKNQMWIQGPPPVFINNEAPPLSRALDALACAIRSCCDQANTRLMEVSKEYNGGKQSSSSDSIPLSVTTKAVMSNEKELCSRNMVLSAFALLQQSEANTPQLEKNYGHHLLVSSMDAFLEGGDEDEAGGFSDSQIQSLLTVCNAVINRPLLLYQPGPTYHMVSNAAIQLCHLLNGIQSNRNKEEAPEKPIGEMESVLFDEVLDTYIALRKILNDHRRKLPLPLRCHGLPRPNLMAGSAINSPFIDLGETLMCTSRGCQGFVLMACSPCVAAERAAAAELRYKEEMALFGRDGTQDGDGPKDDNDMDTTMDLVGDLSEMNVEDDALISILGKIVAG